MMTPHQLLSHLPEQGLFREAGVPWLISPQPLALPRKFVQQLSGLGHVLAQFQDASHALYRASTQGKVAPWLAPMLDAGKPDFIIEAQRSKTLAQDAPRVIRPDLLWCEDGFALSELDSVPGGLGITHFLAHAYEAHGFSGQVIGGAEGMAQLFADAHPQGASIAVSAESADYLPEMQYLSRELGAEAYPCIEAESLSSTPLSPSTLYRFFELFDTAAIPAAQALIEACGRGELEMSPPPIAHLEEKAWLAFFHLPGLQSYWQKALRGAQLKRLQALIPHGWLLDPTPLPPQAALPWLNLNSWQQVAELSQKERRLVLKISGFDEQAWGARGVYMGHDMNAQEWEKHLQTAQDDFPRRLWVMQEFREAQLIEHPYYDRESGEIKTMRGRVRLCPYYFRLPNKKTQLGGCLATIVPADKKKIHGMSDAILVPCVTRK